MAISATPIVDCDASSGSVTVRGAMQTLNVDTSSGSIKVEVDSPTRGFDADASSGSVRLRGGAYRASVDTSSGSITLSGLSGDAARCIIGQHLGSVGFDSSRCVNRGGSEFRQRHHRASARHRDLGTRHDKFGRDPQRLPRHHRKAQSDLQRRLGSGGARGQHLIGKRQGARALSVITDCRIEPQKRKGRKGIARPSQQ